MIWVEIFSFSERKGFNLIIFGMKNFKEWLNRMRVVDLFFLRRKYIWVRGNLMSIIDRCFVDLECIVKFFFLKLRGFERNVLDYCLLVF